MRNRCILIVDYQFSQEDTTLEQIENTIALLKRLARKTKDIKLRRRYDIVRLALQGRTKKDIASIMDMSIQGICNILNCYKEYGIDGLQLGHSTGRRKKLTENQEKVLYETISEKLPRDVGLAPFCNWTAPLACIFVKSEFDVDFSERGMRDVFYRLGLSYTRPTYVLAKADPKKQEDFKKELDGLKKTS